MSKRNLYRIRRKRREIIQETFDTFSNRSNINLVDNTSMGSDFKFVESSNDARSNFIFVQSTSMGSDFHLVESTDDACSDFNLAESTSMKSDVNLFEKTSNADLNFGNSTCDIKEFKEDLSCWAVKYNISRLAINSLLRIIKTHTNVSLPLDRRTLVHTPRKNNIISKGSEEFVYFGIRAQLEELFKKKEMIFDQDFVELKVFVNMDGIRMSNSSNVTFWPISVYFPQIHDVPFVVACHKGTSKPQNLSKYLKDFVNEFSVLQTDGFNYGRSLIKLLEPIIVCDAPARAFVCGSRGHNFRYGCHKCLTEGTSINHRMAFLKFNNISPRTTASDFTNFFHVESPLLRLKVNMVDGVPLDAMHLVYLGVVKKFLTFFVHGNRNVRLSDENLGIAKKKILEMRKTTPIDFQRRCRPLNDIRLWKAAELRQFLLYTGPLILKNIVPTDTYHLFLILHIAIRILSSKDAVLNNSKLKYANDLLQNFVRNFQYLFGQKFCCYNVHGLLHLVSDVVNFGTLDSYSCFKFENLYGVLSRKIKKSGKQLAQMSNRIYEISRFYMLTSANNNYNRPNCEKIISHNLSEFQSFICYKRANFRNMQIELNGRDCYVLSTRGKFCRVDGIFKKDDGIMFAVKVFEEVSSVYRSPVDSKSFFNISYVEKLSAMYQSINELDVQCKCFFVDFNICDSKKAMIPLLHVTF